MNINFDYLDDEGDIVRPVTMDNLRLAYSAGQWLDDRLDHLCKLLVDHKHPSFSGLRGWRVRDFSISDSTSSMYCERGDDSYYDMCVDFPSEWFTEGGDTKAIEWCDKKHADKIKIAEEKKVSEMRATEESERALLQQLMRKYNDQPYNDGRSD